MKNFLFLLAALCCSITAFAQTALTGTISDNNGEPMPGANVQLIGTDFANITDADGFFMFRNVEKGAYELLVSYVGFSDYSEVISIDGMTDVEVTLEPAVYTTNAVIVRGNRVAEDAPFAHTNLDKEEIERNNFGQDVPYLLRWTPSVVVTSDAGTGIGYTGIRVRGSDPTRVNVTLNGIPLNDSESQGTFWVNLPDFASTTESVQIQRGVGTSTNGAGAFGASVHLETNALKEKAYAAVNNTIGSFNSRKHTVLFGTGLIDDKWAIDGRLSEIHSDGYIDRATADLRSYYLSGGYYGEKTIIKANVFSGKERTYQSWYGTPESRINNDEEGMRTHAANEGYTEAQLANLLNSGRTYNFYLYQNEVDDYQQSHYQLHWSQLLSDQWNLNVSAHYTKGQGFFEQFKEDDEFANYGLENPIIGGDTITTADFVRRRWLDNDFYGLTYNIKYNDGDKLDLTIGGAAYQYVGDHFGEILPLENRYYEGIGEKDDVNIYTKANYSVLDNLDAYVDLQYRYVDYQTSGTDNDLVEYDIDETYNFFNPKVGLNYTINNKSSAYASFSVGNREPDRNDFIDGGLAGVMPKHETLYDTELGYRYRNSKMFFEANAYYMDYTNQLVITGALNDVGASVRANVDKSYRLGLELSGGMALTPKLDWMMNGTLSQNKIQEFEEIIYDYTDDFEILTNTYENTDIALSPNIIIGNEFRFEAFDQFNIALQSKYVGQQFLDNTSNEDRSLDAYFVNNVVLSYDISTKSIKNIGLVLQINNVLDETYSSNGYTYSYVFGDLITENFYYPQAGIHFMAGVNINF